LVQFLDQNRRPGLHHKSGKRGAYSRASVNYTIFVK
jgi:hypothetical protein